MLTAEDRRLLADVFRWARANGWERGKRRRTVWRKGKTAVHLIRPTLIPDRAAVRVDSGRSPRALGPVGTAWFRTVAEAVDVLAALGVLPLEFSSAYRAGVESIPWHYAVKDQYGELHHYSTDLAGAFAYAAPVDDYPALTVLRWRQGLQEQARVVEQEVSRDA